MTGDGIGGVAARGQEMSEARMYNEHDVMRGLLEASREAC